MTKRLKNAGAALRGMILLGWALTIRRFRNAKRVNPNASMYVIPPPESVKVERDAERQTLTLRWVYDVDSVKITVGDRPDAINRAVPLKVAMGEQMATITEPPPYARPYFELEFTAGDRVWREIAAERILPLEGAVNFRDLGGYPTVDGKRIKWGLIFRSSNLSELTDTDLVFISALDIKLICDLRAPIEIAKRPDRLPAANPPEIAVLPIHDDPKPFLSIVRVISNFGNIDQLLLSGYSDMLIDANPTAFGGVFARLADPSNLPAIVHCTAGKDRAGTTAALLLLALGVPDEIVIADYSLSNVYFEYFRTVMAEQAAPLRRFGITVDDLHPMVVANPTTLRATIEHIRKKYGAVEKYLEIAGVTPEIVAQLKQNLLE
jgi:protein-tyrosine phosphatase